MTPGQIRAARALLGMTQSQLAEISGVSLPTIKRIETGSDAKFSTMSALQISLEQSGIEFIPANGGGTGVRLNK